MASRRPGSERLARSSLGWLCQRVGLWLSSRISQSTCGRLRSFTVSHVLKYSLNCVIIPSFRVQTWTQYDCAPSHPSAITQSSMAVMLLGSNLNSVYTDSPVSTRIMCWHRGGPWNHHSRSAVRSPATTDVSPPANALYSSITFFLFRLSAVEDSILLPPAIFLEALYLDWCAWYMANWDLFITKILRMETIWY